MIRFIAKIIVFFGVICLTPLFVIDTYSRFQNPKNFVISEVISKDCLKEYENTEEGMCSKNGTDHICFYQNKEVMGNWIFKAAMLIFGILFFPICFACRNSGEVHAVVAALVFGCSIGYLIIGSIYAKSIISSIGKNYEIAYETASSLEEANEMILSCIKKIENSDKKVTPKAINKELKKLNKSLKKEHDVSAKISKAFSKAKDKGELTMLNLKREALKKSKKYSEAENKVFDTLLNQNSALRKSFDELSSKEEKELFILKAIDEYMK